MDKTNNLHIQTEEKAIPEVTMEASIQDALTEEKVEAAKEDSVEINYTGAVPEVRFSNIKK